MNYGIVVDIGATNLRVAIVDGSHNIIEKSKVNLDKNKDIAFNIYSEYKKINKNYKIEKVVVGIPGTINPKTNLIRDLPNIGIKEYDLYSALYKLFKTEIIIVNDASLAAVGEYSKHKDEKIFQYITISSGIGGGLIINGDLFVGNSRFEQEVGRMIVKDEKFENLCSGNALKNRLLKENIDEEYPSIALISKKESYKKVVDEWLDDLSIGIGNIIKIIDPSIIVFGGGLGMYIDYFKQGLVDRLSKDIPNDVLNNLKIVKAYYNDDSALIGGSYLIFQDN